MLLLLNDLCEEAADELKLKILELVIGGDLARLSYFSSKLRCLTTNNGLWKQKLTEKFPVFVHNDTGWTYEEYLVALGEIG